MRYADTSFIVSLVMSDAASVEVASVYRSLRKPTLVYGPLHAMEVQNALRSNQFVESLQTPVRLRPRVELERMRAENKLATMIKRGNFRQLDADWTSTVRRFEELSAQYTTRLGCRTLDILHVALALDLGQKDFITCDDRQAALAKAAGLRVTQVTID